MALTQAEVTRRIDATTRNDTVRGIVFNAAFDLVRREAGDEVARACDPEGTALRRDFHSYDIADFLRLSVVASRELARAHGGADGALTAIGARVWADVSRSILGRTLVSLADGDPHRLLEQVASGYGAVVSYGQRRVASQGEGYARLHFERDFLDVPFHCGVVTAALEATRARQVRVSGREVAFLAMELDVSWR